MKNLSDLKNVKNFLNNQESKRLDLSKKAKKQLESHKNKATSKSEELIGKSIRHFVNAVTQSAASE